MNVYINQKSVNHDLNRFSIAQSSTIFGPIESQIRSPKIAFFIHFKSSVCLTLSSIRYCGAQLKFKSLKYYFFFSLQLFTSLERSEFPIIQSYIGISLESWYGLVFQEFVVFGFEAEGGFWKCSFAPFDVPGFIFVQTLTCMAVIDFEMWFYLPNVLGLSLYPTIDSSSAQPESN